MSIAPLPVSLSAALRDAAEAAVAALATQPMAAGMAGDGTELHEFIPGERARAVSARVTGIDGELVLLLSS